MSFILVLVFQLAFSQYLPHLLCYSDVSWAASQLLFQSKHKFGNEHLQFMVPHPLAQKTCTAKAVVAVVAIVVLIVLN